MARMKTFLLYAILIIVFAIFSNFMLFMYTKTAYYPMENYQILCSVPQVTITKAEANYVSGKVAGSVMNNTEVSLQGKYVKISVYSTHDVCLGSKYIKLDAVQPGETKEFEIQFNYENSAYLTVDMVESTEEIKEEDTESDPSMGFAALIAAMLVLYIL